jgi:hypothetical protein
LNLDPSGTLSGAPNEVGSYFFSVKATDSANPTQTAAAQASVVVRKKLGRNDSIATATPLDSNLSGSLSPYGDSTQNTPDTDFYKGYATAGATINLGVQAFGPLDPVIEILDGNGNRFQTCNDPALQSPPAPIVGDSNWGNFADECINDDIDLGVNVNSSLAFKPAASGPFYLHVFDWRGDARPDMKYQVFASGMLPPLRLQTFGFITGATLNTPYQSSIFPSGGTGTVTMQLASGSSLPPGLTMDSSGHLSGTPTQNGSFSFDVTATDSGMPPQQVTSSFAIDVADPVLINGSSGSNNNIVMPQATTGQAYSYTLPVSGGIAPYTYNFGAPNWCCLTFDPASGTLSGVPGVPGKFTAFASATDAQGRGASANLQLTIAPGALVVASTMPGANNGWIYDQLIPVSGGTPPYAFSIAGNVPPGLTFDPATGDLRGIPTTAGTYSFTVSVTDSASPTKQTINAMVTISVQ